MRTLSCAAVLLATALVATASAQSGLPSGKLIHRPHGPDGFAPTMTPEAQTAFAGATERQALNSVPTWTDSFTLQGKDGAKGETFKLDSATTKTGTLATGAMVTVHYKMDGGNKLATAVTATAGKAAKASTAAISSPPSLQE